MLNTVLTVVQIVLSILLVLLVLVQNQGDGLGAGFGNTGGSVRSTRRGPERVLFISTIVISALFLVVSFALILFSK